MLIVLAISALLLSVAVPSLSSIIDSIKLSSATNVFLSGLHLARSEAIKRNKNVTMSPVTVGSWQDGWQIADPDFAGNIEVHSAFTGLTATGPDSVIYRSSGRIAGAAPSFNISATGTTAQRCVSVDLSGRPYIKAAAC